MAGPNTPAPLSVVETNDSQSAARLTSDDIRTRLNNGRKDDLAAAIARNLAPEHRSSTVTDLKPGDDFDGAAMPLPVREIRAYDRNPRRSINPSYEEIKESVRVKGILNPITVTKRPNTPGYMVYGGGNTRLKVIQELDQEHPGNPLHARMTVIYRAWRGESDVIAAHLIENEARGDTTFWDKACGLIALKKEFETETGATLSSNDARMKAASLGWKVSRDTVQLYDFATDRLQAIGPWLSFNTARVLRDRVGALSLSMTRLDMHGGADAFATLLHDELALQASSLKSAEESKDVGAKVEVDAIQACTALEERVAAATGTSVPELRQMLAILATNPQASASQLRSEAAKGVVVARNTPPKATTDPSAPQAAPAAQIPLPTPMLAAVRSPSQQAPSGERELTTGSAGLPVLQDQGELPPELAAGAAGPEGAPAADPAQAAVQAAQALVDALQDLAAATLNTELFTPARQMPLGYFMELPHGGLQVLPNSTMPAHQQIRLRRAGWQVLAMLSCQFDQRCSNERFLPPSLWLDAVSSGAVAQGLARCGVLVGDGRIHLDADCLFYLMTEPNLLSPSVLKVLQALAVRRSTLPTVLPPQLELVTGAPSLAA